MSALDPAQALELRELEANRAIDETIAAFATPVQTFFEGSVAFVTGGSGFLGKQLIEKLLRSTKIKKIYILLRAKKQKSIQTRLEEILQDPLFEKLHETQPDFVKRLAPVTGDISSLRLGMTDEAWEQLADEVTVIFHMAATINFVEPLAVAALTNVRGTREMLTLAQHCTNLRSFVHVSTAYCHSTGARAGGVVPEGFLQAPLPPQLLIQMAEDLGHKLDAMTPQLLESWPNTYTYTKALAEEMVRTASGDLPICVVRPAIVMPAYREPPGWTDKSTMNGPVGFIAGACLGGLHVMYGRRDCALDMVPVDLVNNASIAAAAHTAARRHQGDKLIKIYTVSRYRKPLTIGELYDLLDSKEIKDDLMTPKILWHHYLFIVNTKLVFIMLAWLTQFIPGYLVDAIFWLCGKKPKVVRLMDRAYRHSQIFSYFMSHDWKLVDDNLLALHQNLSAEDKIIYNCDISSVDNKRYAMICAIGVRKYLLKDGLQGTLKGRRKAFWLRAANIIFMIFYAYCFFKVFSMFYWLIQVMMQPFNA